KPPPPSPSTTRHCSKSFTSSPNVWTNAWTPSSVWSLLTIRSSNQRVFATIRRSTTSRFANSTAYFPTRRELASERPAHDSLPRQAERQANGRLRRDRGLHWDQRHVGPARLRNLAVHAAQRGHLAALLHCRLVPEQKTRPPLRRSGRAEILAARPPVAEAHRAGNSRPVPRHRSPTGGSGELLRHQQPAAFCRNRTPPLNAATEGGELVMDPAVIGVFIPILAIVMGISLGFFGVWTQHKQKLAKLQVEAAKASGLNSQERVREIRDLQERVRVLERIVTDGGYDLATQIEALRDQQAVEDGRASTRQPVAGEAA